MGYQDDSGIHEGYLVGIEREKDRTPNGYVVSTDRWHDIEGDAYAPIRPVHHLQVECTCGWRSQRLLAPIGTRWIPHTVLLPSDELEDVTYLLWRRHVDDAPEGHRTPGLRVLGEHLRSAVPT